MSSAVFHRTFRHLGAATGAGRYGCMGGPMGMYTSSPLWVWTHEQYRIG